MGRDMGAGGERWRDLGWVLEVCCGRGTGLQVGRTYWGLGEEELKC